MELGSTSRTARRRPKLEPEPAAGDGASLIRALAHPTKPSPPPRGSQPPPPPARPARGWAARGEVGHISSNTSDRKTWLTALAYYLRTYSTMAKPVHAPHAPASDSCGFGSRGRPPLASELARRRNGQVTQRPTTRALRLCRTVATGRTCAISRRCRRSKMARRSPSDRRGPHGCARHAPARATAQSACDATLATRQLCSSIRPSIHPSMCMHVSCLHTRIACGRTSHTHRRGRLFVCLCV